VEASVVRTKKETVSADGTGAHKKNAEVIPAAEIQSPRNAPASEKVGLRATILGEA
jgi:hypothetical protein